jgi:hypothetical protein
MVRRLQEDLRAVAGGFPKRVVRQVDLSGLPANTPELRLSVLLDQHRELREERLKDETKRKQASAALLISGLQQRLLSSVEAFARTLRVHRRTVQRHLDATGKEQTRPNSHAGMPSLFTENIDNDDDRATLSEEELQAEEEGQIEVATVDTTPARPHFFAREKQLLDEMTEVAEAARSLPDARVRKLVDWIRRPTRVFRNLTMSKARKITRLAHPPPGFPVPEIDADRLLGDIRALIEAAREQTARAVNSALVGLYWHIGKRIREDILHEQQAGYGEQIVSALSKQLTAEYGRGYSKPNLSRMMRLAEAFQDRWRCSTP